MTGVKKAGREGKLGARPRAREKRGEERVPLSPFSRALCASHASNILFLSLPFETQATQAGLLLKQWKNNSMFLLVTLRFLSNLSITLIASLLYFFHVSAVCSNVTFKLSTGARKPERATSLRSCQRVFTGQFIFRTVLTQILNIF